MTTTTDQMAPGIYRMTPEEYHADPVPGGSLSSSGARKMIAPYAPAIFRYEADHGTEHKRHFDIGSAAHQKVLGIGAGITVIDEPSYRSNAAQQAKKAAHAKGVIPLLTHEHDQVTAMAEVLRADPLAGPLFDTERGGLAEQNLIWRDARTGIMRRARFDWLPENDGRRRLIIPDYKTCASANPDAIAKSAYRFGYHQQADWYQAAARALGLAGDDAAFVFVCQEKDPPYLVTVVELDATAMRIGKARNHRAIDRYRWCVANDTWPGYADDVALISLPPWAEIEEGEG